MEGDNKTLAEQLKYLQKAIGAIAASFDSFLILRGLKTLAIRMERHSENAMQLAQWLEKHPKVKCVYYPGLPSHSQHSIAKKQMRYFGGMISVELKFDLNETKKVLERCQLFTLAANLGSVEASSNTPRP